MTTRGRILVADDNIDAVIIVSRVLEREGFRVFGVGGGIEAVRVAAEESIDVALLDVAMPDMDGLQVCEALRASPRTRDIALILLTARDDMATRMAAMRLGVSEFLTKPTVQAELVSRVRTQFEQRARHRVTSLLLADFQPETK